MSPTIDVIIPAYNEAAAIGQVLAELPPVVREVVVVDNGSSDHTGKVAQNAGATVLTESRKGYGYACLKGIDYLKQKKDPPEILVFLDGDYSDYPGELVQLVKPLLDGGKDFVVGARVAQFREKGALTPNKSLAMPWRSF